MSVQKKYGTIGMRKCGGKYETGTPRDTTK